MVINNYSSLCTVQRNASLAYQCTQEAVQAVHNGTQWYKPPTHNPTNQLVVTTLQAHTGTISTNQGTAFLQNGTKTVQSGQKPFFLVKLYLRGILTGKIMPLMRLKPIQSKGIIAN